MGGMTHDLDAEEIAGDLLARTDRTLIEGRFEGIEDCFFLPLTIETIEGVRIVRTPDDVWSVFQGVRDYFQQNDVTNVARSVLESKYVAEDKIESVHVSKLMRADGTAFRSPFPTFSLLRRAKDGAWRIAHCNYAITDSRSHNQALLTWRSPKIDKGEHEALTTDKAKKSP